MNLIHRYYCRSRRWGRHLHQLLPWATAGFEPAKARVLELGSGPGKTTEWLAARAQQVTAVGIDTHDAAALATKLPEVRVINGDATVLPLDEDSFDLVVCFTMLHHLRSPASQDRLFREAYRVLRPGGRVAGSDSRWGPLFALGHLGDTMTLVASEGLPPRLEQVGFADPSIDTDRGGFRFRAAKAR